MQKKVKTYEKLIALFRSTDKSRLTDKISIFQAESQTSQKEAVSVKQPTFYRGGSSRYALLPDLSKIRFLPQNDERVVIKKVKNGRAIKPLSTDIIELEDETNFPNRRQTSRPRKFLFQKELS